MEFKITAERLREAAKQDVLVAGVLKALFPEAFATEELFSMCVEIYGPQGELLIWRRDIPTSQYTKRALVLNTNGFVWEMKQDDTSDTRLTHRPLLLIPTRKRK